MIAISSVGCFIGRGASVLLAILGWEYYIVYQSIGNV
jgi:hypothetical protein